MNPRNVFAELKRRNVYKVAIAYGVVGWLIVQIATQVFPFFDIPNWAVRLVVLVAIVGFPIALVIAWAFELTPSGLKRTESADDEPKASRPRGWLYVVLVGAFLSVALFFLGRFTVRTTPTVTADVSGKSIAVLPFDNLSHDPENAYFADGIQDEILTRLAKIAELKVISRTSTQRFKSAPGDLRQIAQQLGVTNILEGSVQKTNDQVRVNVQLINAALQVYDVNADTWIDVATSGKNNIMPARAPVPKPGILDIDLYVPGESNLPGGVKPVKLSSNESPLGASPKAIAAYRDAAVHLERYPDGGATALRTAIGARYGLDPARIVCGAGSDELLFMLAHAYLGPGDEAIYTEHGFLVYRIAILANGATPVVAPERELTTDVDAILARVTARTRMVFLANPNNPTGTYIGSDEVARLRKGLPGDVVLVLDGAYAEYVKANDYAAGIELVATTSNTVMTRTFSKIYGLAALRLGWAYGPPDIIGVLNRLRGPFNISTPGIAAGVAAMEDTGHINTAVAHNERWLAWLSAEVTALGLNATPSVANFVLIHFPGAGHLSAANVDAAFKQRGIIVRRVTGYGLPEALRITIGSESDNRAVIAALSDIVGLRAA